MSRRPQGFHPYAETLFGPDYFTVSQVSQSRSPIPLDKEGITSEVVIGVEADLRRYLRWRVLEFTKGTFSGVSGSQPQSLITGIVIHVP